MQVPAMVLALATTSFAREACLEPKQPRQKGPVTPATAESYEEDQVHQEACNDVSCSRCRFEAGFAGRLRRGHAGAHEPDANMSWSGVTTMLYGPTGEHKTWLTVRPYGWGGSFAVGCWICNTFGDIQNSFSRITVNSSMMLRKASIELHSASRAHKAALTRAGAHWKPDVAMDQSSPGAVSGVSDTVPRLEKFVLAAQAVSSAESFQSFAAWSQAASIGTCLASAGAGDTSSRVCKQIVRALSAQLWERDQSVARCSTHASIGVDERDSIALMQIRFLYVNHKTLGKVGVHEALAVAIEDIVRRFCTVRQGRRGEGGGPGPGDVLDEELFKHVRHIVIAAAADRGPTEQKCLVNMSSAGPRGAARAFFPNLSIVSADPAHKMRSVQRGMWKPLDDLCEGFMADLINGDRSFARLMESSRKYSLEFERQQRLAKIEELTAILAGSDAADSAVAFAGVVRNLAYAEQRFDSRSRPLLIFFSNFPVAVKTLAELASTGDRDDRAWAKALLLKFSGPAGFSRMVKTALSADALIMTQKFVRQNDKGDSVATSVKPTAPHLRCYPSRSLPGLLVCSAGRGKAGQTSGPDHAHRSSKLP